MNHIIVTGANGTLAPYLIEYAQSKGIKVSIWDRHEVSIDNQEAINQYIKKVKPDAFFHLATGDPEWIRRIIIALKPQGIPLTFTSTESVFGDHQQGPFSESEQPESKSDYGQYKITCESIINETYADASYIIRLGWQIGLKAEKNNMLAWLKDNSPVHASSKWIPSTSFMPDTVSVLLDAVQTHDFGTYHLDGNNEDMNFFEIASRLNDVFKLDIEVIKEDAFVRNNRLISSCLKVPSINERLY